MIESAVKEYMRAGIGVLTFIALFSHSARYAGAAETKPLKLIHADRLISSGEKSEIVNLVGHVHLIHEGVDLYSEKATWYRNTGLVQFIDSVVVVDSQRTINSDLMTYYRRDRHVSAKGNVKMRDSSEDLVLNCDKAEYYRQNRQFEATGSPVLIFHPEDDSSKMEIKAKRMEYFPDKKEGFAYESVSITQREMTATSGQAQFFQEPEGVILTRSPVVYYEEDRLVGDSISLYTKNKRIDRLLARGNAGAYYRTQPDTSIEEYTTADLTGRELEAFFDNDKITKAVMRQNAVSVYTPAVTDTLTRGVNTASGDSITLYFDGGSIRRVFISGGAQGEYVEPKLDSESAEPVFDTTRYLGSEIDYSFENSEIQLLDNSELHYHDMILTAGDIRYKINDRILTADGIEGDSAGVMTQLPVLTQGTEKLDGRRMSYNLQTKKGQVLMARTKFEDGFYDGARIRQVSEDVLLVTDGDYTSCDRTGDAHYHFHSNRMKMVNKDKVIAKPVILYIGELPVFAVPYYVFPVRKGRHSGFLTFEIGNFERGQRFIRNLGYYWAASDYWDLETSVDFYENVRTIFNSKVNYALRYRFDGDISVNYSRDSGWVNYLKSLHNRWQIVFHHTQIVSRTSSITASGHFISDKKYTQDNVFDQAQRLNARTVKSSALFKKNMGWSSINVSADQTWNLDTDLKSHRLPAVSFTLPSFQIIPDPTKKGKGEREKPWEEKKEPKKRFYHSLYFTLNSNAVNSSQRLKLADSTFYWKKFQTVHSTSTITSPQKILGFLTVNPGMNVTYTVYHVEWNRVVDTLGLRTDRAFTRYTYDLGVTSNTNIYGTVYPNIFGITGLRHVVTPAVTYRFTPEIKKNEEYRDYTGTGLTSRRSKSMTFSLGNLFQAKYRSGETEKRIDLLNMNFSGGYDFVREERKISNVNFNVRTGAIPHLSVYYVTNYSFYNFDNTRRPLTNPRIVDATISTSLNGGIGLGGERESDLGGGGGRSPMFKQGGGRSGQPEAEGVGMRFSILHSYRVTKSTTGTTKDQWIELSTELHPTSNWAMTYTCHYDFRAKGISRQELGITRDMHCWEGSFKWIPSGPIAGYYIRIDIKSLPDIKLEKSEGGVRG